MMKTWQTNGSAFMAMLMILILTQSQAYGQPPAKPPDSLVLPANTAKPFEAEPGQDVPQDHLLIPADLP